MPAQSPEAVHALLEAAFNAGDLDAFVEIYDDDATLIVPPRAARQRPGRDPCRGGGDPRPSAPAVRKSRSSKSSRPTGSPSPTLAGASSRTDGGERVEMSGRGTIVSRRQPDGSWRIVLDNPLSPE